MYFPIFFLLFSEANLIIFFSRLRQFNKVLPFEEAVKQPILNRQDNQLVFVVREPFLSKMSQVSIGYGHITTSRELKITSHMPTNGVIFSDGIESDFLAFNSGSTVTVGLADKKALLVV